MAFAPTKPWKLPFITTWGGSPNRNLPTNSAEEAELIPETGQVAAWGDARASGGLAERVLGLLGRLLSRRFSRFSHIPIFSQLLREGFPCNATAFSSFGRDAFNGALGPVESLKVTSVGTAAVDATLLAPRCLHPRQLATKTSRLAAWRT